MNVVPKAVRQVAMGNGPLSIIITVEGIRSMGSGELVLHFSGEEAIFIAPGVADIADDCCYG